MMLNTQSLGKNCDYNSFNNLEFRLATTNCQILILNNHMKNFKFSKNTFYQFTSLFKTIVGYFSTDKAFTGKYFCSIQKAYSIVALHVAQLISKLNFEYTFC